MLKSLALLLTLLAAGAGVGLSEERHVVMILIDGLPATCSTIPRHPRPSSGAWRAGVSRRRGHAGLGPVGHLAEPDEPRHGESRRSARRPLQRQDSNDAGRGSWSSTSPRGPSRNSVRVPPMLFDVLKRAGQTSAAINWPCTRGSTSIDDNFPDVRAHSPIPPNGSRTNWSAKGCSNDSSRGMMSVQDEIWTEAACEVIRTRMPRFLALHLNNVDSTHHRYGPRSTPGLCGARAE